MFVSWRVKMDSWYFKNMSKEYTPDLTKHMPSSSKHTPICLICSFGCWIHVWHVPHLDMWSVSVCQAMCIMDFPFASLVLFPTGRCCLRPECERLESESQICESRIVKIWSICFCLTVYLLLTMTTKAQQGWLKLSKQKILAYNYFIDSIYFVRNSNSTLFFCFGELGCSVFVYIISTNININICYFSLLLSNHLGTVRCTLRWGPEMIL